MGNCFKRVALLLAVLVLGGCSNTPLVKTDYQKLVGDTLAKNYAFDAKVEWQEEDAVIKVEKTGPEEMKVTFLEPEALKDLVAALSGEDVTLSYRGMKMDLGMYDIPAQSILPVLWDLLSAKSTKSLKVTEKDDTVKADGSLYMTGFTITFDKKTMNLQKIEVPELETLLTVTKFEFL